MLTNLAIAKAKPRDRPYRMADRDGLCLLVTPAGGKLWRFRYRFPANGNQRELALGPYPLVPLASHKSKDGFIEGARELRDSAKRLLLSGTDPMQARRKNREAAANIRSSTVAGLWDRWSDYKINGGFWAAASQDKTSYYMRRDILPRFGSVPLQHLERRDLADAIIAIEKRSPEAADKLSGWLSEMFSYGIASGLMSVNVADSLRSIQSKRAASKSMPSVPLQEVPALVGKLKGYGGRRGLMTRIGAKLLLLNGLRPGELRFGEWAEVDFEERKWVIPKERMKMGRAHTVPLSDQAMVLMRRLYEHSGSGTMMFPNRDDSSRVMSENTINQMFRKIGYGGAQTGHGFRKLISTNLNELGYEKDFVEKQLAHGDPDESRSAYNFAEYLVGRRKMMCDWADLVEKKCFDAGIVNVFVEDEEWV